MEQDFAVGQLSPADKRFTHGCSQLSSLRLLFPLLSGRLCLLGRSLALFSNGNENPGIVFFPTGARLSAGVAGGVGLGDPHISHVGRWPALVKVHMSHDQGPAAAGLAGAAGAGAGFSAGFSVEAPSFLPFCSASFSARSFSRFACPRT